MIIHGMKRKFIPILKRRTPQGIYIVTLMFAADTKSKSTISILIPGMMKTSSIVIHLKVSKRTAIICIIDI